MSYRDLDIYQLARELSVKIHRMTLRDLPRFELYEEGSQIRRSVKSIRSNLVEGSKADFIKFLVYAHASCDETLDHIECLHETESLVSETLYHELKADCEVLGAKLNRFIQSVEKSHRSE